MNIPITAWTGYAEFGRHDAHVEAWVWDQGELYGVDQDDDWFEDEPERPWTDEDEAGLEEFEEHRRVRLVEANEY